MKIVTWNVIPFARDARMVGFDEVQPDVVCVQELSHRAAGSDRTV